MIVLCIRKLLLKNFYLFFLQCIRINGKNINFDEKKVKKAFFTKTEEYIVLTILMLIIY